MLAILSARVRAYCDTTDQRIRDTLAHHLIPGAHVEAYASHLATQDAQRIARSAMLVRNAERLPLLAAALRADRTASPANPISKPKPKRKPVAVQRIMTKHDACEALKRAARDFLKHPTRTNELRNALRNCAEAHRLALPNPKLRKRAADACPVAVHIAALDCGYSPSPENFANAVSTLLRYEIAILAQHDAQPVRLLNPKVRAPEPNKPQIHRAPHGSLDWSTQPIIGIDPAILAEQSQYVTHKRELLAKLAEKRAKRIEPKRRKARKPANTVSKAPVKWNARMGKEVLTLSR